MLVSTPAKKPSIRTVKKQKNKGKLNFFLWQQQEAKKPLNRSGRLRVSISFRNSFDLRRFPSFSKSCLREHFYAK